ncbi:sigma factor [Streptomyces sp. ADI93-02]|uniref:sigma factor n=1 Tax=Streptomyces sp. ADI93-02 TaxID=1522757 RepID=UPI000F555CF2|nr:sigma factor [Streptomyces sp. ADI93-02]RPK32709.1 ECF RNA polymerase sigma factor SigJ [Streptomyces sp. ADI93-02]
MSAPSMETPPVEPPADWSSDDDLDLALDVFLAQRTRLFRKAYQVLGDVSGAEDVVQEMWLRWQLTDRTKVRNPAAYLATATARLAINVVQSAQGRHETPTESYFADLADRAAPDPAARAEKTVAIEEALALPLAKLTPEGLAAYILRKGFGYAYDDLAKLLRTTVPNARQLVRRAQIRLERDRERPVPPETHRRLVAAFQIAADTGDFGELTRLLAPSGPVHRAPSKTSRTSRPCRRPLLNAM